MLRITRSRPTPPLGSCCTLGCAECQNASGQMYSSLLQALDLLQRYCEAEHGCTERVDTTVPAAARHVAMQRFSDRDRCAVSSCELHAHSALLLHI